MGANCLACGKPLGGRSGLCYSCERSGTDLEDVVTVDDAVRDRVERYLIVASIRCADCGDVHGTVTVDGVEYTAADFGIESVEEWDLEMEKEDEWLRRNEDDVRSALVVLEDEWPRTVRAIRTNVLT